MKTALYTTRKPANTRRFAGATFLLDSATIRKKDATDTARLMRRRGWRVRVVTHKAPGVTWYILYVKIRKKKRPSTG